MYTYPELPKQESLELPNTKIRADARTSGSYPIPSHTTIKNTTPDKVTDGAYQLPGSELFATANIWREVPQPVDIIHRVIHQPTLSNALVYRSGLQAPRRESPNSRINPPSITKPGLNSARFLDRSKGDVYGG